MNVYIDADACPVKDMAIAIAKHYQVPTTVVKSFAHFSYDDDASVETIYVDAEREAADYRIMKLAVTGDVIITQDYGLASLALAKGCHVLHHKGFIYTNENIDRLLQTRHISALARKSGKRTKGPKPMTNKDKQLFNEQLVKIMEQYT